MAAEGREPSTEDRSAARARLVAALRARAAAGAVQESVESGPTPTGPDAGSTVGTGSAVAIGCTALALVVTVAGVLFLLATRWF